MENKPNDSRITEVDFGGELQELEPELRQMAIDIANELHREQPEEDRYKLMQTALQRAKHWWMDRAG